MSVNDKNVLNKMKAQIVELRNLTHSFNDESIVDKDSLLSSISYVDITLDMEILKIDEYSTD